jgi:hypothetical protein
MRRITTPLEMMRERRDVLLARRAREEVVRDDSPRQAAGGSDVGGGGVGPVDRDRVGGDPEVPVTDEGGGDTDVADHHARGGVNMNPDPISERIAQWRSRGGFEKSRDGSWFADDFLNALESVQAENARLLELLQDSEGLLRRFARSTTSEGDWFPLSVREHFRKCAAVLGESSTSAGTE